MNTEGKQVEIEALQLLEELEENEML